MEAFPESTVVSPVSVSARRPVRVLRQAPFLLLLGLVAPAALGATLYPQAHVLGPTPEIIGFNLAHFYPGSNTRDWWRYAGVNGARIFMSPSQIEPSDDLAPVGDGVTNETAFLARRAAMRTNQFNPAFLNWSVFTNNYQNNDLAGNNHIKVNFALAELRKLGVEICAQITASQSRLPISGSSDWTNKWELWQHYYAQAFYLGRYFDVQRYQMYNEPNHPNANGLTQTNFLIRLQLVSDAVQAALADVNALYGKSLVPTILAPVTSGSADGSYAGWGEVVVTNRHSNVLGQPDPAFQLVQAYDYHQYDSSPAGFGSDLANLNAYLVRDMTPEAALPTSISEFNTHTGANFDTRAATLDSPSEYSQFGSIALNLISNSCGQLYAFKFGQTDYTGNYPVQKNAFHYVDNDTAPYNTGGVTKAGEVWRLLGKAFRAGRQRLSVARGTGAGSVDAQAAMDALTGRYWLFACNNTATTLPINVDLSAWNVPTNAPVLVEEVSESSSGAGKIWTLAGTNRTVSGTMSANSVWLLSTATTRTLPEQVCPATDDAETRDGSNKDLNYGTQPLLTVRNDPTNTANRSVAFLKFQLPTNALQDLQFAVLSFNAAGTTDATVQAHIYGLETNNWTQKTITWTTAPNLKNGKPAGGFITNNIVNGAGTNVQLLGQVVANSRSYTAHLIDVTEFVRSRTNRDASFLISQDPRWNITLPSLAPGDTQPGGLLIASVENPTSPPPCLRLVYAAPPSLAPQVRTNLGPRTEAVIRGGAYADTNPDEIGTGYIMVKYSSNLDFARKAYFQFDLSPFNLVERTQANLTVNFAASYPQYVQLWALDQVYESFSLDITWNQAQANDKTSNGMLTGGAYAALPIGSPVMLPAIGTAPYTFAIQNFTDYVHDSQITLVLAGVTNSANDAGGLRLQRTNALLQVLAYQSDSPGKFNAILSTRTNAIVLSFEGVSGSGYVLQSTTGLLPANWVNVATNTADSNGTWYYTDFSVTNQSTRYYRSVRIY